MARNIKFRIKDKNTIVLKEDAKANDFIDISEISSIDKDTIAKYLSNAEDLAQEKAKQIYDQEIKKEQMEWKEKNLEKDLQIKDLSNQIKLLSNIQQKEKENLKNKLQLDWLEKQKKSNSEYENRINTLIKKQNEQTQEIYKLSSENNKLKYDYKTLQNTKAMQLSSTKSWGEQLEKYVWETFESAQQNGAYPRANFFKDNLAIKGADELKATKGDFIFKDFDDKHNEILSIEIEVKTHQFNTSRKTHNKDHFESLHQNRIKKNCEYALLISELEEDNHNFDGIYKVQNYEKMYVVRPASFLSFINILEESLKKNNELIAKIADQKNIFADQETFKKNWSAYQSDVQKTVSLGTKSFDEAIKYIDKTIADLEKTKEKIKNAGKKMITASNKITDITYKKLIKGCNNDPFNNNNGL